MTRPSPPPLPEVPESAVSALQALYREGTTAEPSLTLDRCILEASRAELQVDGATKAKRSAPWWKSWLPVTSAIAVAAVGLSVTWRVMDEQERHLYEEMRTEQVAGERAGRAAAVQRSAETPPSLNTETSAADNSRRADSAVVRNMPAGVAEPEPEAKVAPSALASPAAPVPMVPMAAEEPVKKSQRAETDQPRDRRDASAVKEAASSPLRHMGKLEVGGLAAGSSAEKGADSMASPPAYSASKSVAAPNVDAATPEAWLKHIRELRAAGRSAEAAQSLARFRASYPSFVLPEDLLNLK